MTVTKNIVLIGMMGSGKTTVGKLLANRLGWKFIDTDAVLEHDTGKRISDIFHDSGEEEFRLLEMQTIAKVSAYERCVIATGGGVVLKSENITYLRAKGIVIFLDIILRELLDRLRNDDSRPLLNGDVEKKLNTIWEQRSHLYRQAADWILRIDGLSPEEVVQAIMTLMEEEL